MTTIRPTNPSEDEELARILCNAFLPIWNHNWLQVVRNPLNPVIVRSPDISALSSLQSARIRFYLSLIKSTRLLGGEVLVNIVDETDFGAILLWLPAHARMGITNLFTMYYSGFLRTMYDYGLWGVYRIVFVFEANIEKMFKSAGVNEIEHDFVEMLASSPKYAGRRLASQLLRRRVERCQGHVMIDTTTMQAERAYEKMGFKVLGRVEVKSECDELGIQLRKGQKLVGLKHVQRVMMLKKADYIESR